MKIKNRLKVWYAKFFIKRAVLFSREHSLEQKIKGTSKKFYVSQGRFVQYE